MENNFNIVKRANSYPDGIKFKYDWRRYQKRILNELDGYLNDNHLHIIAPPGSGKTVLGLEVGLRLNKPTLILAPTIAIRNQWVQRFCELFLQVKQTPNWISTDINSPKFFTVSTYQALHASCNDIIADNRNEIANDKELQKQKRQNKNSLKSQQLIKLLKKQSIGTIIVDEAHHLKNAWWRSLTKIIRALDPTIVGLTATPPYDVSYNEWKNYLELNGSIDTEISVPELVAEGDLCPHQDFLFFSNPTIKEGNEIENYRIKFDKLFNEIKSDKTLAEALEKHPFYQTPKQSIHHIYSDIEFYSATLIFLNSIGKKITKEHLAIVGDKKLTIPELNYEWLAILLKFYLYKDDSNFSDYEPHRKLLIAKLKRNGAIERRTIDFKNNKKIDSLLSSSISKLNSINQIVAFENEHLRHNLRMVILTDYIRKEFLVNAPQNNLEINKIGVIPIFEQLRRNNDQSIKIGVLTGSLIIIPVSAYELFKEISSKYNIETSATRLKFDSRYLIVNPAKFKHHIVSIVTQVFEAGQIEVLIGTKSLLGEGWDAPSINSLILASFVGSYVLSNQMRGRAIRTDRKNIDKTGNIWHLVCVDNTLPGGGTDMDMLRRRFKAFVGVSFDEDVSIENGIGRFRLPERILTNRDIQYLNKEMLEVSSRRDKLRVKWIEALKNGVSMVEEIKIPFPEGDYRRTKSLYYRNTIKYLSGFLGAGLAAYFTEALKGFGKLARNIRSLDDIYAALLIITGVGVILFGGLTYKTFRLYIKYRDISKDTHKIGIALLKTLVKIGVISTEYGKLKVVTTIDELGTIYCRLEGGTTYEESVFIKSLQEIINAVKNPRYIIIRKSLFAFYFTKKDFHSVPDVIGMNKQNSLYFESQWRKNVGRCKLVYTRTIEGRKFLLRARMSSLAAQFQDKTERINKWR